MSVVIQLMAPCFLLQKQVGLLVGPLNVVPHFLDVFAGSRHGYQFWGNSKGDIYGELGLPTVHKKIGADPIAELWVQLYVCTTTPILPFQSDLWSRGSVPSMLIKMELNLSHWPFVWGWYELVLHFLVPVNLQRLAMSSLSNSSSGPKGFSPVTHNGWWNCPRVPCPLSGPSEI